MGNPQIVYTQVEDTHNFIDKPMHWYPLRKGTLRHNSKLPFIFGNSKSLIVINFQSHDGSTQFILNTRPDDVAYSLHEIAKP